jgi:hypothetical protein
MRLFEVADRFVDDLQTILRNEIGKSDVKQSPKTLTWEALSNLLSPFGYGNVDYAGFSKIYDANPSLQPLIKNFNEEGIILGTEEESDVEKQTQVKTQPGPSIDQMADRAVSKGLQPDFK